MGLAGFTKLLAREDGVEVILFAKQISNNIELMNETGNYVKVNAVCMRGIPNCAVATFASGSAMHEYHPIQVEGEADFRYAKDAPGADCIKMSFTFFDFFTERGNMIVGADGTRYAVLGNGAKTGFLAHPYFSSQYCLEDIKRFPKHHQLPEVYVCDDIVELRVGSPEVVARFAKEGETPEEIIKTMHVEAPSDELIERAAAQLAELNEDHSDE